MGKTKKPALTATDFILGEEVEVKKSDSYWVKARIISIGRDTIGTDWLNGSYGVALTKNVRKIKP